MSYSLEILLDPRYYVLHIAIAVIAVVLLATLFYEIKKPKRDPNENKDTKRMNDILKED